jgi:uncharacterized protein YlxW (UPF0749 family)
VPTPLPTTALAPATKREPYTVEVIGELPVMLPAALNSPSRITTTVQSGTKRPAVSL